MHDFAKEIRESIDQVISDLEDMQLMKKTTIQGTVGRKDQLAVKAAIHALKQRRP